RTEGYDRIVSFGDDAILRQPALDAVLKLHDEGWPIVTGYSNLARNDYRVNLASRIGDNLGEHDLYDLCDVMSWPEPMVPTALTGYTLLCMERDFWRRFDFQVYGIYPGWGSDFNVSKRFQHAEIEMVAAREGFCYHVKDVWNVMDGGRKAFANGPQEVALELA